MRVRARGRCCATLRESHPLTFIIAVLAVRVNVLVQRIVELRKIVQCANVEVCLLLLLLLLLLVHVQIPVHLHVLRGLSLLSKQPGPVRTAFRLQQNQNDLPLPDAHLALRFVQLAKELEPQVVGASFPVRHAPAAQREDPEALGLVVVNAELWICAPLALHREQYAILPLRPLHVRRLHDGVPGAHSPSSLSLLDSPSLSLSLLGLEDGGRCLPRARSDAFSVSPC